MVRHAERDAGADPPLNERGRTRAQALADELADDGVTAIYYPDFIRNAQTAAPFARLVKPAIRTYSQRQAADSKHLAAMFVEEATRKHVGGVVLWIGNTGPVVDGVRTGNLYEVFVRLGGAGRSPTRYHDLYRITLHSDRPPRIEKGTYGASSGEN